MVLRRISTDTVAGATTPSSSGAQAAQARNRPKPTMSTQKPRRAGATGVGLQFDGFDVGDVVLHED